MSELRRTQTSPKEKRVELPTQEAADAGAAPLRRRRSQSFAEDASPRLTSPLPAFQSSSSITVMTPESPPEQQRQEDRPTELSDEEAADEEEGAGGESGSDQPTAAETGGGGTMISYQLALAGGIALAAVAVAFVGMAGCTEHEHASSWSPSELVSIQKDLTRISDDLDHVQSLKTDMSYLQVRPCTALITTPPHACK